MEQNLDEAFEERSRPWRDPLDGEPEAPQYSRIDLNLIRLSDFGRLKVRGESHYQEALYIVAAGIEIGRELDEHLPVDAVLVPEPENPHDIKAVRVDVLLPDSLSLKVGYLPREVAPIYQPQLLRLRSQGDLGVCPGRLTGGGSYKYYGIYLHIAAAADLLAPKPEGLEASYCAIHETRVFLRPEWICTVVRDEEHQRELRAFAAANPNEIAPVLASLTFCSATKGKYVGRRVIEVRLGGRRVGELTVSMSERYECLLDDVTSRGATTMCDGYVRTDPRRGLQLELFMPRDPSRPRWPDWHNGT